MTTLADVASITTGTPISHEFSTPSVSIHHIRANKTARKLAERK